MTERKCFSCRGELELVETVAKGRIEAMKMAGGYSKDKTPSPIVSYRVFECTDCGRRTKR